MQYMGILLLSQPTTIPIRILWGNSTRPEVFSYPAKPQLSDRNQRLLHRSKDLESKLEISHPKGKKNNCAYFKYYQYIILGEHFEVWFSVLTTQYILIFVRAINVILLKTILGLYVCNCSHSFSFTNFSSNSSCTACRKSNFFFRIK